MRHLFLFLLLPMLMQAQVSTEIYVFELNKTGENFSLSAPINVTRQNPGYDNQPHFLADGSLYYVSERDGQTEVFQAGKNGEETRLTSTAVGGEYSPTPIPGSDDFSAIRLDTTGLQLLYRYSLEKEKPEVILKDVKVGYHQWVNQDQLLTFVLGEPMTLQFCNVSNQTCEVIDSNIGRSIHKIPGTELMSYTSKKDEPWEIRSFNPATDETKKIVETLRGSEDLAWSPDGTIFMAGGNKLYSFKPGKDKEWQEIADLGKFGLEGLTRIAVNPEGNKIAVVVNE